MKTAITILLALAASGEAVWLDPGVGITVKFDLFGGFYPVPLTIEKAKEAKWIEAKQLDDVPEHYKELVMYCYECAAPICALYEQHSGYVAGLQIGINKDFIAEYAYNLEENGFKEWTWTCNGGTSKYHTLRQYFVTRKFLLKSAEDRKLSYDTKKILQNGVVVTDGPGGQQELFSEILSELKAEGKMTEQNCVPFMGHHYYYNMTETLECSAKTIYPFFLLVNDQKVIGCPMMTFLKLKKQSVGRDWFEHPSEAVVKQIVPRGPPCLYELAKTIEALTVHVYFMNHPRLVFC